MAGANDVSGDSSMPAGMSGRADSSGHSATMPVRTPSPRSRGRRADATRQDEVRPSTKVLAFSCSAPSRRSSSAEGSCMARTITSAPVRATMDRPAR